MPEALDGLPRRVADWAVNRSLAPTSVNGISLALGLCAAAWFSAGTRLDNIRGAVALLASYLAWRAARWLGGPASRAGAARSARAAAGTLAELSGTVSDYAVYAGLAVGGYEARWSGTWALATAVVIATAVRTTAVACGGHVAGGSGQPNPLSSLLRGFLAFSAGGRVAVIVVAAPVWGAHATLLILLEWGIIATAYVITGHGPERVAVEDTPGRFRPAGRFEVAGAPVRVGSATRAELSAPPEPSVRTELSARAEFSTRVDSPAAADASVTEDSPAPADAAVVEGSPAGADAAVVDGTAARADAFVMKDSRAGADESVMKDSPAGADAFVMKTSVVSAVPADQMRLLDSPAQADQAGPDSPGRADPVARADSPVPGDSRAGMDSPARAQGRARVDPRARLGTAGLSTSAALTRLASGAGQSETPLALASSSETTMTLELMIHQEPGGGQDPKPKTFLEPRARATIAAYRDDGAAAVWLSRVVRGQFVPLPPAVAGLAATSFLAWLGMRNLGGLLLLTPLVVMLLAAFGSGHPHNGRLDWLVPALLVAGQLVYIAAIGFSFGVWAPVTFTLCALIALRYVGLARRDRRDAARGPETRLGWEGRMLAVGIGAMLGITVVAFIALSIYVAVLVCGRVRASVLALEAADRP
jgi:hypothetical protein